MELFIEKRLYQTNTRLLNIFLRPLQAAQKILMPPDSTAGPSVPSRVESIPTIDANPPGV
jgi:hypothetical protein